MISNQFSQADSERITVSYVASISLFSLALIAIIVVTLSGGKCNLQAAMAPSS